MRAATNNRFIQIPCRDRPNSRAAEARYHASAQGQVPGRRRRPRRVTRLTGSGPSALDGLLARELALVLIEERDHLRQHEPVALEGPLLVGGRDLDRLVVLLLDLLQLAEGVGHVVLAIVLRARGVELEAGVEELDH